MEIVNYDPSAFTMARPKWLWASPLLEQRREISDNQRREKNE
jgi:hypothetical protein